MAARFDLKHHIQALTNDGYYEQGVSATPLTRGMPMRFSSRQKSPSSADEMWALWIEDVKGRYAEMIAPHNEAFDPIAGCDGEPVTS